MKSKKGSFCSIYCHIIDHILNKTIIKKVKVKGTITKLNELFKYLFHFWEDKSISLRKRTTISAETIATPYGGKPGVVNMVNALDEIVLDKIILGDIQISNMVHTN